MLRCSADDQRIGKDTIRNYCFKYVAFRSSIARKKKNYFEHNSLCKFFFERIISNFFMYFLCMLFLVYAIKSTLFVFSLHLVPSFVLGAYCLDEQIKIMNGCIQKLRSNCKKYPHYWRSLDSAIFSLSIFVALIRLKLMTAESYSLLLQNPTNTMVHCIAAAAAAAAATPPSTMFGLLRVATKDYRDVAATVISFKSSDWK